MTTIEPWHLADGVSAITPDRLENLVHAVERTRGVPGDMAELGVYKGGSAKVIATVRPEVTLHLFDTFEGLPWDERPELDPEGFLKRGMFSARHDEVMFYLAAHDVRFYPGLFEDFEDDVPKIAPLSFVHIDCDLGEVAEAGMRAFWPALSPGGIMYFDDYGCKFTGVTEAVDRQLGRVLEIEEQFDMYGNQIGALVCKPSA